MFSNSIILNNSNMSVEQTNKFSSVFSTQLTPQDPLFYYLYSWHDIVFLQQLVNVQGAFSIVKNIIVNLPFVFNKLVLTPAINWFSFHVALLPVVLRYVLTPNAKSSFIDRLQDFTEAKAVLVEQNLSTWVAQAENNHLDVANIVLNYEPVYFRESLFNNLNNRMLLQYTKNALAYNQANVINLNINATSAISNILESKNVNSQILDARLELGNFTIVSKNSINANATKVVSPVVANAVNTLNHPLFSAEVHNAKHTGNVLNNYSHPFHLVDPSPWPFCTSIALWYTALTTVSVFHGYLSGFSAVLYGVLYLVFSLAAWWRDVIRESTYEFKHTPYVRRGLLNGMTLFIVSEVMFFFGFFWAFFHSSLVPSPYIGGVWPPHMLEVISPWQLPLVNTLCLLLSGVTLTISHRQLNALPYYNHFISIRWQTLHRLIKWLQITIALGVFFLGCQAFEYYYAGFTFQDTVYGGTFYILTGLHGLHVMVGTIFLIVCLWRASRLHFTLWKQVGFKSAVWYWHFVDVVWIFLYLVIYVWGNKVV